MMWAIADGEPTEAQRSGERGHCPACADKVIAKVGPLVAAHWAHVHADCDPWSEPETPWHVAWKKDLRNVGARVEVAIGKHRADAAIEGGVVEIQHSSISAHEARARETFYGRMIWVFDMTGPVWGRVHFGERGLWWKHGSRTQTVLQRPIFWHTPDDQVLGVKVNSVPTKRGVRVLGQVHQRWERPDFISALVASPTTKVSA